MTDLQACCSPSACNVHTTEIDVNLYLPFMYAPAKARLTQLVYSSLTL